MNVTLPLTAERPLVGLNGPSTRLIRLFDVMGAAILLLLFAPLMALCAIAIYAQDGSKVVFAQRRFGFRGRTFLCYKLRTMHIDADERLRKLLEVNGDARAEWAADHKLRNDPRITRLGRFMRKLSLDELPQLFNVLLGDMSLVGPRPIVAAEVRRYGRRFRDYCAVRPGITGIWQISGRNDVAYGRRVAMDTIYARQLSLKLYFGVLLGTAVSVARGRGAY